MKICRETPCRRAGRWCFNLMCPARLEPALIAALLLCPDIASAQVWSDCAALKQFCKQRPYHRDCEALRRDLPLTVIVECAPGTYDEMQIILRKNNRYCTRECKP